MIDPFDPFGQVMLNNLKERGCDLLGIESCPSLDAQKERMMTNLSTKSEGDAGVLKTEVECHTMKKVYDQKLEKADK